MARLTPIHIDPEFKALGASLSTDELRNLEASILTHGCLSPLVVWKGPRLILDGHNRYDICGRHATPYDVREIELEDRWAAMDWIDQSQLGRRNLSPEQRQLILGRLYERQKQREGRPDKLPHDDVVIAEAGSTSGRLAKAHGVSSATIERAGMYARAVAAVKVISPDIENRIARGEAPPKAHVLEAARVLQEHPDATKQALSLLEPHEAPSERRNASTKAKQSALKDTTAIARAIAKAFAAVAFVPSWPEPVRNPLGGGLNPSQPFSGCGVVAHGKMMCFALRSWPSEAKYPIGDPDHVSDRLKADLVGAGKAGAVAGLIVAATNSSVDSAYWVPWTCLRDTTVSWEDPRLVPVGTCSDFSFDLRDAVARPLGIESRVRI